MVSTVTSFRCACIYVFVFYSDAFTCSTRITSFEDLKCRDHADISYRDRIRSSSKSSTELLAAPDSKQIARQLYEENIMPIEDDARNSPTHNLDAYDQDDSTPLESEFKSLMETFLTYTERDIRSLTSTSCRYLAYADSDVVHKAHVRSKEIGIRYRALFEGVQSGAREPAVLRSFSVLFEDYLPIRLAGRRIYNYLDKVIEEIRLERQGEINRASGMSNLDREIVEYAHDVWDALMDESLLMEDSLNSLDANNRPQDVGVLSLTQLQHLNIVKVLIEMKLIDDKNELVTLFNDAVAEVANITQDTQRNDQCELTFVSFVRLLYQCVTTKYGRNKIEANVQMRLLLKQLEQQITEMRHSRENGGNTSTLLAAKAIHSGSENACKKRQRHSDKFDEYVLTFKVWEDRFVGDKGADDQPSRRLDILRGCFSGARDAKVVAALKIVYMDYTALRLAGDLIFKLMSKIAG